MPAHSQYSCCYISTDIWSCKQVASSTRAEYSVITQNISASYSSFDDTGVIYVQVCIVFPYYSIVKFEVTAMQHNFLTLYSFYTYYIAVCGDESYCSEPQSR